MNKMRKAKSMATLRPPDDQWIVTPPADVTFGGTRSTSDGEKSESSMDVLASDIPSSADEAASPAISRGLRIWHSFKSKTKKLRSISQTQNVWSEDKQKRRKKGRSDGELNSLNLNRDLSPVLTVGTWNLGSVFGNNKSAKRSQLLLEGKCFDDSVSGNSALMSIPGEENSGNMDVQVSAINTKVSTLRSLPFFVLDIILKEGKDLVIRDSCGTSDPYVRFHIGNKQLYKSRTVFKNLNPKWEEKFSLPIEDPFKPIHVDVFDYDRGMNDDPMGWTTIHLTEVELNIPTELRLPLREDVQKGKSQPYMGYLVVQCTLVPKTQLEKEEYERQMNKFLDQSRRQKTQLWNSVVSILLIDGAELLSMDDNGFSDPYVKFKLGNERYKSRYKPKTLTPTWLERFDLYKYDDQTSYLELAVWDHDHSGRDDMMGRAAIDLSGLEREKTHDIKVELEDGAGFINILLTISGTAGYQSRIDLNWNKRTRIDVDKKYGLLHSFKDFSDLGWLQVKVIKAQGLAAADVNGKSDPFCVLELVNARLQTHTEYKTLAPLWDKTFTFVVSDIHSVLEVSVFDEDRDKKYNFLGKVAIPLMRIRKGQKVWYQLKDRKLVCRTKGAVLLELDYVYNQLKAAVRTFNPREKKYLEPETRFRVSVMKRNIDRVFKFVNSAVDASKFINSCFVWTNKLRSILAFAVFLVAVWNFDLYMLPLTLLIIFFKNLLLVRVSESVLKDKSPDMYVDEEPDLEPDDEKENKKEEKKSFKEKLQAIQEACLQVQEIMDQIASMGERIKNSFVWTVPWLSWLMVIALMIVTVVLYFVPLRILVLLWGINKFTKKLRAPNSVPNNELLDYLSRVPSDSELIQYRELRPDATATAKKKHQ